MKPPDYSSASIKPIRPPEVEGEIGHWSAVWQLETARLLAPEDMCSAEAEVLSATGIEAHLTAIADRSARLQTITEVHPLEVEAWPAVDSMLLTLDRILGLVKVNDCPRDWWRPFRRRNRA
jgi:hypothetical protein